MAKITNIDKGPRGINLGDGVNEAFTLRMLNPGETYDGEISDNELASIKKTKWFKINGKMPEGVSEDDADAIDDAFTGMDDAALRDYIEAAGESVHHATGRTKLLAKAREIASRIG